MLAQHERSAAARASAASLQFKKQLEQIEAALDAERAASATTIASLEEAVAQLEGEVAL